MNEHTSTLDGKIDGLAQALLRVVAELEMARLIDGPRVSAAWRNARPEHLAADRARQASRSLLLELAEQLDDARAHRQSR